MNILTSLALRYAARNIQSLLDFIGSIDTALDAYIARRESEAKVLQAQIEALQVQQAVALRDSRTAVSLQAGVQNLRG
jgi:hypothetical protein